MLITGFPGVDDPHEPPKSNDVRIDTTALGPDEEVEQVLVYLRRQGFIALRLFD